MFASSFQKQWELICQELKKKKKKRLAAFHRSMHFKTRFSSPHRFLVTEGFCPGKSSRRWKQRGNLSRCLTNELWSVELWLTMRVNGQIMLQEVTGHFSVSFFSFFFFFTITFSWGTKDLCPELQSTKLINSVIKSQNRFIHSWGHNSLKLYLLCNALK